MEITEQKNIEAERKERYDAWANKWEGEMTRGQLTHIQNDPAVEMFVDEGKVAIPYILDKLQGNRLWYIPLEKIIENEYDRVILSSEDLGPDKFVDKTLIDVKFAFLEDHRVACLKWARKNKFLPEPEETK